MYHRFEENKYPSTNIRISNFKKQVDLIKNNNFYFVNANKFENDLKFNKEKKKILLTIDDAFLSFYQNVPLAFFSHQWLSLTLMRKNHDHLFE